MSRVVIVGARGMGREALEYCRELGHDVVGFLDSDPSVLTDFEGCPPILGAPEEAVVDDANLYLVALGDPAARKAYADMLAGRGARFLTLVHPQARVSASASVGEGSLVAPFCYLGHSATVGRHALLNYFSALGHDAAVGDFGTLCPRCTLGGFSVIEEGVFLGTQAAVSPKVRIGAWSKIGTGRIAMADVPPETLVLPEPVGFVVPN